MPEPIRFGDSARLSRAEVLGFCDALSATAEALEGAGLELHALVVADVLDALMARLAEGD